MLYVVSKTQDLEPLYFVKSEDAEEACRMIGCEDKTSNRRLLTDSDVEAISNNEVVLIKV